MRPSRILLFLELLALWLVWVSPVAAHADLVRSDPADEADLQAEAADVFTVAGFEAEGIGPLTTEELEELTVGKTLTTRHLVTGQEASIHYAADGIRTIFFGPHQVVRNPYEIKDGMRIEQTAQGIEITVKIYTVGNRYIAARADQAGYANFEIFSE